MHSRLSLVLPLLMLTACQPTTPRPDVAGTAMPAAAPKPPPPTDDELRKRMSEYVHERYSRDQYPKLYAMLGKADPTQRIQDVREGGALKALRSGRCDFVELAEISNARTTSSNLVAFVDCRNLERFYVSESDLANNAAAVANSQRMISRGDALVACAEAARSAATFPSLVDPHVWTGASYSEHKTMGSIRVLLNFDATNALGAKLPYRANCLFPAGSLTPELTVTSR